MKKDEPIEDDLRPEYRREDLGKGVRGKYYHEYTKGTNLVLLSPDVAEAFPTTDSVNEALRTLIRVAQAATRRQARRPRGDG
jgi:hypothetical protein